MTRRRGRRAKKVNDGDEDEQSIDSGQNGEENQTQAAIDAPQNIGNQQQALKPHVHEPNVDQQNVSVQNSGGSHFSDGMPHMVGAPPVTVPDIAANGEIRNEPMGNQMQMPPHEQDQMHRDGPGDNWERQRSEGGRRDTRETRHDDRLRDRDRRRDVERDRHRRPDENRDRQRDGRHSENRDHPRDRHRNEMDRFQDRPHETNLDPGRNRDGWREENSDHRRGREAVQCQASAAVPSLFDINPFAVSQADEQESSRAATERDMNIDLGMRERRHDRETRHSVDDGMHRMYGMAPDMNGPGREMMNNQAIDDQFIDARNDPSLDIRNRRVPDLMGATRPGRGPEGGLHGHEEDELRREEMLMARLEARIKHKEMAQLGLVPGSSPNSVSAGAVLVQAGVPGIAPGVSPGLLPTPVPGVPPGAVPVIPPSSLPNMLVPPPSLPLTATASTRVQDQNMDGVPMFETGIASRMPPKISNQPLRVRPGSDTGRDGRPMSGFTPDGIPVNVNDPLCDPSERQAILQERHKQRCFDQTLPQQPGIVLPDPSVPPPGHGLPQSGNNRIPHGHGMPQGLAMPPHGNEGFAMPPHGHGMSPQGHGIPQPPPVMSLFSKEEEAALVAARRNKLDSRDRDRPARSEGRERPPRPPQVEDRPNRRERKRLDKEPIWKIPEDMEFVDEDYEKSKSEELFSKHIALEPSEKEEIEKQQASNAAEEGEVESKKIPAFLMCPLCKDLLDDPVVLPCFHTLCRVRCVRRITKDDMNVWCPQCGELKLVKAMVANLKPAVTFEKMIAQHREEREKLKQKAAEGTEPQQESENIPTNVDPSDELTCKSCTKIYSLPVRLTCGHSICKFPCAYKEFKFNTKVVCPQCETPSWLKGVSELPVAKDLVAKIQKIKGEFYLTEHSQELRAIDRGKDIAQQYIGITALFDDDEKFKKRLQKLDSLTRRQDSIPSLISMPWGAPVHIKEPEHLQQNSKKKNKRGKKRKDEMDEDFNPDELYPGEEGHQMYDPFLNGEPCPEVAFNQGYGPPPGAFDYGGDPYADPYNMAPVDGVVYNGEAGAPLQPQATFQPPVLDVKSMVPDNPGLDFDYIQPWNLFAQQTQNYYASYYSSAGGIPPEAEQQVKDYLEKCWSWYSAYFKLQTAKQEAKAEKKSTPVVEPATEDDASELANRVKKLKTAKNKKEKEKLITEFSFEVAAAVTKDEKKEELEIEELKILLLKKQLELKLKNAKSKSEARDLKKLKELVEEEEGKDEELDAEAQQKKEQEEKEAKQKEIERVREAARLKQLDRERQIEELEKQRKRSRVDDLKKLQKGRRREQEKREREEKDIERRREEKRKREERRGHENRGALRGCGGYPAFGRGRGRGSFQHRGDYDSQEPNMKRRKYSRSRSRSGSKRSPSGSRSRSRGRTPEKSRVHEKSRERTPDEPRQEETERKPAPLPFKLPDMNSESALEPKFVKITNLPDDVTAKSLKSFVEAFGKVINCKIGKMQGELMAVCQMQNMADAISCVREMHGLPFKSKLLDVRYMGNKPNIKQVEVALPDVYDRPKEAFKPAPSAHTQPASQGNVYGGDKSQRMEQKKLLILNLPWGTTEREVIDFVSHHAFVLHCRVATNPDRYNRGLYAEVVLESYFDVLKCINVLHGIRYEGRQLEVKKVTI